MTRATLLSRIRRVWAIVGSVAFIGFTGWCLIAYRASSDAQSALTSGSGVSVAAAGDGWTFTPASPSEPRVNLLFLPGALVDPAAYAPLLHRVAAAGYPARLVPLPWRGAFGRADGEDFLGALRSTMAAVPGTWVIAGHSRGGKIAATLARNPGPRVAGLILLGTTHPRDFSLAGIPLAVAKIYGTSDGVAPAHDVLERQALLPPDTRWTAIEGANHSQFGYYGFQPGDHWAGISREEQQAQTLRAVLDLLDVVRRGT